MKISLMAARQAWVATPVLMLTTFGQAADELPETIEFNRDIRPILSDNCYFCHGPDKNKRQADLRLDTRQGLLERTGDAAKSPPVIPGKSAESELIRRIESTDRDAVMPPVDSGKQLTPREIALLKRWIEQGAPYEGHWAFLPIRRPDAPVIQGPGALPEELNLIDRFVRQQLISAHLESSGVADRTSLIRRLSFDLIGLPPSTTEVDAFLADDSPDAYERVVDRLLESPHFGERMAIWWLDLVRYADSVGYHGDQDVSVSPFREYVIASFNANKRFDEFTTEQLAGDLLPNPTREQLIASGYNRLGMMSAEGGVQDKEYLAKYIAERVRNASGTWLGVTLGCAECHDHKFDPFTARDFYRFEAFFADIQERGLYSGSNDTGSWGPSIRVPNPQQEAKLAELDRQIAAANVILAADTEELRAAQRTWEQSLPKWTTLKPEQLSAQNGTELQLKDDGTIHATGPSPATDTYVLKMKAPLPAVTAFRLDVLPDDSLPQKGPGRAGNGNFVLSEFVVQRSSASGEQQVALQNASATYEQTGAAQGNPYGKWAVAAAIDGDAKGKTWGWAVMEKVGQPQAATFETAEDLVIADDATLTVSLVQNLDNAQHTIGRFRLSATAHPRPVRADTQPPQIEALLAVAAEQRTADQQAQLAAHFRSIAPQLEPVRQQLAALTQQRKQLESQIPTTLITASVAPRMVRVLRRGNWMDDSGEEVLPGIPAIFADSATGTTRLNRLDLAKWVTSSENPLTARVVVNRIWKLMFGAGISRRVDDLGAQGDWPSHPLLLDFLASQFIESGWDVKQLIKTMVMSETYRQSSHPTPAAVEHDPYNRWLSHQGRFRLDAEFVRDNALAISGLLVTKVGGLSVKPYQPPGYWAHLNFPQREWQNSSGDELYRRGIYTHWQRQYLHPSLLAFDAPCREECTADRARSNTPLQSLVLLNDPTYVEAARGFAELILHAGGSTTDDRLAFAFRRAVSRPIQPAEVAVLKQLLDKHLAEFRADPAAAKELLGIGSRPVSSDLDASELAAWTSVARALLNLHETITRN